tara:strand:+ start:35 stop:304 length:270 start_codon:yes stop_codon:yes gene_type:complete
MKLTKTRLKQIIKEEMEAMQGTELAEDDDPYGQKNVEISNVTAEMNRGLNNALYNFILGYKKDGWGVNRVVEMVQDMVKRAAEMAEKAQ